MPHPKLPQSLRKHIRKEKARMRREGSDVSTREKAIAELMQRFRPKGLKS